MELTKYNTAVQIDWLTDEQKEYLKIPNYVVGKGHYAHLFDKNVGGLGICGDYLVKRDNLIVVPFDTFKSIHFPDVSDIDVGNIPSSRRQEDETPSYEELVDALRKCNELMCPQWLNELLERIK